MARPQNSHSTHAIDYSVDFTEVYSHVPLTRHPVPHPACTLLTVAIAGVAELLHVPCLPTILPHNRQEEYFRHHKQNLVDLLLHHFPYIPDCYAKNAVDSFSPILQLASATHRCPNFRRHVRLTTVYYVRIRVQPAIERAIRDSFEEAASPKARPATKASVRDLFKAKEFDESECVICMEEMKTTALRMPCSHLFHESCLVQWLGTSHVCPLCHYQMPTDH